MAIAKDSPQRRRSIAVLNQSKPIVGKNKRRAYSIVPGDHLSPLAKARRSLVPRKSILKVYPNILRTDDDPPSSQPQSQSQSQSQSQPRHSHVFAADDANATQSMDITNDFNAKLHDNTSRQSLGGRRVSFAAHVRVRVIEGVNNTEANGVQSPESSIESSPEQHEQHVTDENDYPSTISKSRRRSSVRHSLADSEGEDMDLTTIVPSGFAQEGGSTIEEFDGGEEGDEDDMDVTEVIHGEFIRKRSLSLGVRHPLAQIPQAADQANQTSNEDDQPESFAEDDSRPQSEADSEHSEPMEFTMPLRKSLRPPVEHDEVWLALRKATHSGDTPIEHEPSSDDSGHVNMIQDDGMELDDAVQRLMRARESLPLVQPIQSNTGDGYDDTFSSAEDSFENEVNHEEQTINVSKAFGRVSLGGTEASIGYQESTMDESGIYGAIVQPNQSTPRQSLAVSRSQIPPTDDHLPEALKLTVFQPPPSKSVPNPPPVFSAPSKQSQPQSAAFSFTPRAPTSPKKNKTPIPAPPSPSKSFSAAFAPPVVRPIPKKGVSPSRQSPGKRPRQTTDDGGSDVENIDADRPSPAKRIAVAGKWPINSTAGSDVSPANSSAAPKPLSPSKKAPFQVSTTSKSAQRPSVSLRRPSDYFARRKSLGIGLGSKPVQDDEGTATTMIFSPKKKAGLGLGRASIGSGPPDAWKRFDKNATLERNRTKQKEPEVQQHIQETFHQVAAEPSLTRRSPAPASPRPPSPSPSRLPETEPSVPIARSPDAPVLRDSDNVEENEIDTDMKIVPKEQWRDSAESNSEHDGPPISIEQFFFMTGIKFMDELTAPRRSTHPSQQSTRQARSSADIPLSEYVTAMGIDIPQLVLYSRVSRDLQAWIEKSKSDFAQAEDEAAKITPELFTEYTRADEEGQAELLYLLQLIRTNTRGLAKSDWYDWKLQWLEGLRTTADRTFKTLETDARAIESILTVANDLIPALKKEYEDIMQELEKENAEVAEIEASDQEYLNELKTSIAEQNIEVEALQAEVSEGKAQLAWLQERLEEIESEKKEVVTAITDAQRILHIQKNSTMTEVFRVRDELEALEDLHLFRATKVHDSLFEYIYASQLRVSIPCKNFIPIPSQVDVTRLDKVYKKTKDDFPHLSSFFLKIAKQRVVQGGPTIRQMVHRLNDYWSSCAQLRSQLKLLTIKYPVEIELWPGSYDESSTFKAKAMVLFLSVKAKAFISFIFDIETFSHWPMSIGSLRCEVDVVYGPVDRETITNAITSRLEQASPANNYGCLLDACIEAQDIYH